MNTDPINQLPVCLFAGAGGTGKTEVVKALNAIMPERDQLFSFMPSISRDFYKSKGFTDEKKVMGLPEERRVMFQTDMFYFYCESLVTKYRIELERVRQGVKLKFFACDRSPFDHLAYVINSNPSIALDSYKNLSMYAEATLNKLNAPIHIALFPYPAAWTKQDSGEDGFRAVMTGRNLIVDGLINKMVRESKAERLNKFSLSPIGSAKQRAQTILINLQPPDEESS